MSRLGEWDRVYIPLKPCVVLDQASGMCTRGRAANVSLAGPSAVVVSEMLAGPLLLAGSQVNLNGRVGAVSGCERGRDDAESDGVDMV